MNDKGLGLIRTVAGKLPRAESVQGQTHNKVMEGLLASQDEKSDGRDSVAIQAERSSPLEMAHPATQHPLKAAASAFSQADPDVTSEDGGDGTQWMNTAAICIGLVAIGTAVVVLSGPLALATAAAGARLAFAGLTSEVSEDGLPSVIQKTVGAFVSGAMLPYSATTAIAAVILSEAFTHVSPEGSIEFRFPPKLRLTPLLVTIMALVALTQSHLKGREVVDAFNRHTKKVRRRLSGRLSR